jgi:hypothetical protein
MDNSKLDHIINIIREEMTSTGGNLAGLPPDEPPVNKKKKNKFIFLGPKSRTSWTRNIKQK